MPVIENRVCGQIRRYFAKAGFETRLTARAAYARLCVAHDARRAINDSGGYQGLNGQIRRRRIAARIRDEPRSRDSLPAEFRQPVDSLRQQLRRGMLFLVPA